MISIHTKRLIISPMTETEMRDFIAGNRANDPEVRDAYQDMLDGCIAHPEQHVWYCAWKIVEKNSCVQVGDVCFKGFHNGSPEIGYGLYEGYYGNGYATESVTALCEWAFSMPGVVSIEAEAESDNIKSNRVLSKVGFAPTGTIGAEGPRYILMK